MQQVLNKSFKVRHVLIAIGVLLGLKLTKAAIKKIFYKISNVFQMKKVRAFIAKRNEEIENLNIPIPNLSLELLSQIDMSSLKELKQMLDDKIVTSQDLVNIYASRCKKLGIKYSIITQLKYNEAIEIAKYCDNLRASNPSACKGLLFGIPISLKETYDEKGYPSTIGCIYRLDHIPEEDGCTAKLLKQAGAIVFVRTNVPQAAMTFESCNAIYGRVANPWNTSKYAGGSSGGEAASIAAKLSPAGIGSDIGGSIRIPAGKIGFLFCFNWYCPAMCGVFGFKPTAQRSLMEGHTFFSEVFNGQNFIPCSSGPLGKSVDDLVILFRALSEPQYISTLKYNERDQHFPYLEFNNEAFNNTLSNRKFGYFKTTEVCEAALCMQRGVDITIEALRSEGHTVVEVEIKNSCEIYDSFVQVILAEGLETVEEVLNKEGLIREYDGISLTAWLPFGLRTLVSVFFKLMGAKHLSSVVKKAKKLEVSEYNRLNFKIFELRNQILGLFDKHGIEAIICPAFGAPALDHKSSLDVPSIAFYTFLWNVMNFPCGVVPVTVVNEDEQHFLNADQKDFTNKLINHYMKKDTKGMPVAVQVVTPPFKEEVCLNIMKIIEKKINFYQKHPLPHLE